MLRIEKSGSVWTVIHSRFDAARNAVDPESAEALVTALLAFDADTSANVAVLRNEGGAFCAGWDLKFASTLSDRDAFQREVVDGLASRPARTPRRAARSGRRRSNCRSR